MNCYEQPFCVFIQEGSQEMPHATTSRGTTTTKDATTTTNNNNNATNASDQMLKRNEK